MTRYILQWWVPALGDWIKVGEYRTLQQAQSAEDVFRTRMADSWVGELKLGITEIVEREV